MTNSAGDADCPKAMQYGPCGGVRHDDGCEVDDHPCPFVGRPFPTSTPEVPAVPLALPEPLVLVDVRAPQPPARMPPGLWEAAAEALQGCWALIGDHVDNVRRAGDTGYESPVHAISVLAANGVPVVATVTGRDTDVARACEAAVRMRDAGAAAVHCVTGDHPAGLGIARPATFSAESMTLAAAVAAAGVPVTVAESPDSPGPRAVRLAAKQRAGASAGILNHAGEASDLIRFADECSSAGVDMPLVAPVPMVADVVRAAALAAFPGLRLPAGMLDAVASAPDPLAEGVRSAAELASALAASGRFAGCNLSGSAGGADALGRLETTKVFVAAVRDAWRAGAP